MDTRSARSRTVNTQNSQPPPISAETQQLLKLMMEESKLTNFQQRQLSSRVKGGEALPLRCHPTSSKQRNVTTTTNNTQQLPKVLNGRNFSGGKRPKEVIDVLAENNNDQGYRPAPRKIITDKDKAKLQNKMAYGDDLEGIVTTRAAKRTEKVDDDYDEIDEFDECLKQIEERRNFLSEMESLGQGAKYKTMIQTEISQKIRELELIDKKRTKELEQALKNEK